MRTLATLVLALAAAAFPTQAASAAARPGSTTLLTPAGVRKVAPTLDRYSQNVLFGDLWKRPGLSPRDRCIVTLAALIARNQTAELPSYLNLALDAGVKPGEISGIITHLAFYSGWGNAMGAVAAAQPVFRQRRIATDQLPSASAPLLQLDEAAEEKRAAITETSIGPVFPAFAQYTNELLFRNLWQRPDLAPRDRSLVTVSALIASGQVMPLGYHLNRAMDYGLTQAQAVEVITHLAFYAGWPYAVSAVPVAKEVFEKRP
jgi:4-carboxymuconolactone decarboxylase